MGHPANPYLERNEMWGTRLFLQARDVPELDGIVVAARCQGASVGAEGYGIDFIDMALQGAQELPRGRVPELDGIVAAARGESASVGAEGHGADAIVVALQGAQELS